MDKYFKQLHNALGERRAAVVLGGIDLDELNVNEEKILKNETKDNGSLSEPTETSAPFNDEDSNERPEKRRFFSYDSREKCVVIGKFRIKRKILIAVLVILLLILGLKACSLSSQNKMRQMNAPENTAVERRTVQKKVTGSSVIEPKDSYSIMTITTGEVTDDYINEGDTVKKGDKLYQFDAESPQNNVDNAKNALARAQQAYNEAFKTKSQTVTTNNQSVQSAKIAVERAQQTYNDARDALDDIDITSDISGTIGEVFVSEGDMIQAGGRIATVYSDK